jgi:hypothetical protein
MAKCPSYSCCFLYFASPPLGLVLRHLPDHRPRDFDTAGSLIPFEFLLGVLTPTMSAMLPVRIADTMLLLRDMYPATFETVTLDNNEVDADVPFMDLDGVWEAVGELALEERKNEVQESIRFVQEGQPETLMEFDVTLEKDRPQATPVIYEKAVNIFNKPLRSASIAFQAKAVLPVRDVVNRTVLVDWPFWKHAVVNYTFAATHKDAIPQSLTHHGIWALNEKRLSCRLLDERNHCSLVRDPVSIPICLVRRTDYDLAVQPVPELYENCGVVICGSQHSGNLVWCKVLKVPTPLFSFTSATTGRRKTLRISNRRELDDTKFGCPTLSNLQRHPTEALAVVDGRRKGDWVHGMSARQCIGRIMPTGPAASVVRERHHRRTEPLFRRQTCLASASHVQPSYQRFEPIGGMPLLKNQLGLFSHFASISSKSNLTTIAIRYFFAMLFHC